MEFRVGPEAPDLLLPLHLSRVLLQLTALANLPIGGLLVDVGIDQSDQTEVQLAVVEHLRSPPESNLGKCATPLPNSVILCEQL